MEDEEEDSDRREVQIEHECLRSCAVRAVASDLRRMATVLKVNRDWERIADLSPRWRARARKLCTPVGRHGHARGDSSNWLAMCSSRSRASYRALASREVATSTSIIAGDAAIDAAVPDCANSSRPVWPSTPTSLTPGSN